MFDTKQSRARVLAFGFLALATVGTFVSYFGDRAMEEQREGFVAAGEDRLADIDVGEAAELVVDDTMDTSVGEPSELTDLLVIDGRSPQVVTFLRDGFEATYRIEAWTQSERIVVRVDADGLTIDTE